MAEEETQRGSTKRQIARLIGNASIPIYILGSDQRILFANDALAQALGVEADMLIGLDCSRNIPIDTTQTSRIAVTLALPPNTDLSVANLHPLLLPGEVQYRICVSCPLEATEQPMTLCAIKEDHGDRDSLRFSDQQSRLKRLLSNNSVHAGHSADLWFLRGASPSAMRTLKQIQAASMDRLGVHVTGPSSNATLAVAKSIAWKRRNLIASGAMPTSLQSSMIVECPLMDAELLRSTLDMIDEHGRTLSKTQGPFYVILHQVDSLQAGLIDQLVRWHPASNLSLLATSSARDLIALHSDDVRWGEMAASLESHVVYVPSMSERITDIEALVVAWLESTNNRDSDSNRFRWTAEFLEAMLAYSWPGDMVEFDAVMREATLRCQDQLMTDQDLPSSLRTFPSHLRRPEPLAKLDLDRVLEEIERNIIQQALSRFPRNRAAVANHLGISRSRLLRRLQQLGLEKVELAQSSESDEPIFEEWNEELPGGPSEPDGT